MSLYLGNYRHEKFSADNYQTNTRFQRFLEQGFIPSIERRELEFVTFDFVPHKPGDHYRGEVFPVDYENTERYNVLTGLGYKPVVKTSPAGKVIIDFEPPATQPLELIVNVTPVIEPGLSSREAIDYAETSHTLWIETKEDFGGPIFMVVEYLSRGIRKGAALINNSYWASAKQSYLERKKRWRERREQLKNQRNHLYDSKRL